MILESLELENFRQFIGTNTIHFSDAPKKTTIIFGGNGRGKTGIYRAVMFCLFGERKLAQDDQKGNILLVNTTAVRQNANIGTVSAKVTLTFTHDDCRFIVKREIKAAWNQDRQMEDEHEGAVSLIVEDRNGNSKPVEAQKDIKERINSIIHERVKEYFLFDGEKMEMLTRADGEQQKAIGKAVKQILGFDSLKIAIDSFEQVRKGFAKDCERNATGNLMKYHVEKGDLEEENNKLSARIIEIDNEETKTQDRKVKLELQLKRFEGVREKMEELAQLEADIKNMEHDLDTQRGALTTRIKSLVPYLCFDVIKSAYAYIGQKKRNKEIPSTIRAELIEELLEKHECICGRPIADHSDEFDRLQRWQTDIREKQSIDDAAYALWHQLDKFQKIVEERTESYSTLMTYSNTEIKIRNATDKRNKIFEEIEGSEGSDREDLVTLPGQLKKCEEHIDDLRLEKKSIASDMEKNGNRIKALGELIQKEEREKNLRGVNEKRRDLAEETKNILEEVQRDYISDIRKKVSEATTNNLRSFLDESSKDFFTRIEVDDKCALQIFDRHDTHFLGDISAGQRQLLSLAFVTALAQTASGDRLFYMPLFMDTPFGRLSLDHRLNLIHRIPELCAQWILLATDTELRREEAEKIKETQSLGYFYHLVSTDDGSTRIERVDGDNAMKLLRQGKEVKA